MSKNLINASIKKIDNLIHEIDPLGLGGAAGEYSDVVFKLYQIAREKKGEISNSDIKKSFEEEFGSLADVLNEKDFILIKDLIKNNF